MNLNASNCHLSKMNSIRGFSRTLLNLMQSVMACLNFRKTYFRKHLLLAAFIRSKSTCFSKHTKVDALFIKQTSYFLLVIFLFKELPKKKHTFILTSMERGNSIIAFHHIFIITFYAVTLQKLFFTGKT